jgi:predicted nucleic acid-binding protein
MVEELTAEEHKLAREIEARMDGRDTSRLFLAKTSRDIRVIKRYSEDRVKEAIKVLIELEFLEEPDWEMLKHIPYQDREQHLAEHVLKGLNTYDAFYRSQR